MLNHSFHADDVSILLHPVEPQFFTIEEKEQRIQSGIHYSRMLSPEKRPKASYLELFDSQVERFGRDLARDVLSLAGIIAVNRKNPVLVSLVRAGTPVGVILKRILAAAGIDAPHYSVSIVRDRGLDMTAIQHIIAQGHHAEDIVFVDGWTGKGVIRGELSNSLAKAGGVLSGLKDELYVIGDIAGVADFAATRRDSLIPSCLLNAPVSGLISRSVTRDERGDQGHGGTFLADLQADDRSLAFVDRIAALAIEQLGGSLESIGHAAMKNNFLRKHAKADMQRLIRQVEAKFGVRNHNLIKPGIGESSRVLLRRVPECLLVSSLECPAVEHLIVLAKERGVPVKVMSDMHIKALAIIKEVGHE